MLAKIDTLATPSQPQWNPVGKNGMTQGDGRAVHLRRLAAMEPLGKNGTTYRLRTQEHDHVPATMEPARMGGVTRS